MDADLIQYGCRLDEIDVNATLIDLLLRIFMLGWMALDQVQYVAFCFLKSFRILYKD